MRMEQNYKHNLLQLSNISDAVIEITHPHSLLINQHMCIERVYGDLNFFSEVTQAPSHLKDIVSNQLFLKIESMVSKIFDGNKTNSTVENPNIINHENYLINIFPLGRINESECLFFLTFNLNDRKIEQLSEGNDIINTRIKELEDILESTKQHLQCAMEDLDNSNKELEDFTYITSHDLKEPLRGILNYSNFLLEDYVDELDEDGKYKLHTLVHLSQRMHELIDSLLHYSRVGRFNVQEEQIDLNKTLSGVLDSLDDQIKEHHVDIYILNPLPSISANSVRMNEIFYHLIMNAIKFNDKDTKKVEIGCYETDNGQRVFFVRDNGIGIPDKHKEAIFSIFRRLHSQEKFSGGTGAGLTIIKKIIEYYNGDIWMESVPNEGSTFYFSLAIER